MIAEWLYEVTCFIGACLNNAFGFEHSPHSDAVSGTLFLWFTLICVLLIAVCFMLICAIQSKKEKK